MLAVVCQACRLAGGGQDVIGGGLRFCPAQRPLAPAWYCSITLAGIRPRH